MKKLAVALLPLAIVPFLPGCSDEMPTEVATGEVPEAAAPRVALPLDETYGVPPTSRTYEITLENLTPATADGASQPFSPPVIATHQGGIRVWRAGHFASDELAQIAEDAVNGPMVDLLGESPGVWQVTEGGGVILPGGSASYTVQTAAGFRMLSMAFMLVNTNDAFSGTDSMILPSGDRSRTTCGRGTRDRRRTPSSLPTSPAPAAATR